MVNVKDVEKAECYGCNACSQVCEAKCIKLKCDEKGFLYPIVNESLCIKCKLCIKVCPIYNSSYENIINDKINIVYAIKNTNSLIRKKSSSGGMFTALSDYVLSQGGIVCGAIFDENFKVIHKCVDNIYERNMMRGSKYVQSEVRETFTQTKDYLQQGKMVLYTGTPCQISALYNYLGKNYENLITCDLVCHGVPSPKVFSKYIELIEKNYGDKIVSINFRDKSNGWDNAGTFKVELKNSIYSTLFQTDPYCKLFLDNTILRPICYKCKHSTINRVGDITIGDFWGIKEVMPDFYDSKGVSLVLVNSYKAKEIFSIIEKELVIERLNNNNYIKYNAFNGAKKVTNENEFWNDYINNVDFKNILEKYSIKNIMTNIEVIQRLLNEYIISQLNYRYYDETFIQLVQHWINLCDTTFFEVLTNKKEEVDKYSEERQCVNSYGAFNILCEYVNKS